MNSKKITTNNPLMAPNKIRQKDVKAGDFNKLWDDVEIGMELINDLQDQINNLTPAPFPVRDMGLGGIIYAVTVNTLTCNITFNFDTLEKYAGICFSDVMRSVHYTGNNALVYGLSIDNGATWVEGPDPDLVRIDFMTLGDACPAAVQTVLVKVEDGAITSCICTVNIVVEDNNVVC